jgi:hypothetical protein
MYYQSIEEAQALLTKFERGTMPLEEWDHSAHLAVCCLLLMNHPAQAEQLICDGIKSLNRANGVISTPTSGYHETLSLFWIAKVRSLLDVCAGDDLSVLNAVVGGLASKSLVLFHFSRERIMSMEARQSWCEPDLHPLPEVETSRWTWPQRLRGQNARLCA